MQTNALALPNILVGQVLVIPQPPAEQSPVGQKVEGQRGTLTVTLVNLRDGGQRAEYNFQVMEEERYLYMKLEGDDLVPLQDFNNRPVKIWGTIDRYDSDFGMEIPVLKVERFEVLYPDLHFQILKGTQSVIQVGNKSVTLFTAEDGQIYAQTDSFAGLVGNEDDQILVEALAIPDETMAGYPVLQVVSAGMAVNPKSGQPLEMEVTANKPYVMDEIEAPEPPDELSATIEQVELVYFTPNQRYKAADASAGPTYIQPVWRFQGHYWDGSEFEILVQALKDEFLLPEIETIEPPG